MKAVRKATIKHAFKRDWRLYVFLIIPVVYTLVFKYIPMGGLVIAFEEYKVRKGIWGSDWVGFENFLKFFESYQFGRVVKNTIILSLYNILAGFPVPIIFALAVNSIRNEKFKKFTTTVVNLPHFISTVVIVGIVFMLFNSRTGIYGNLGYLLTGDFPTDLFASPSSFRHMYVWSGVWQNFGWNSIIYTAALSSVDPTYHEAAQIDGATRFQRILHVDLPSIVPTIITMLILRMGTVMTLGFEKIYLMQNSLNLSASQVISTYVYEVGLSASGSGDFSYATAIGMFNNLIELILVVVVNKISKKVSDTSLW
ncbi:MAG: sugar ABC transporter permease [Lachnospiraceae bacterium]|nr:sugar ABC transporter permease [Lachnospiraceae bacterium]